MCIRDRTIGGPAAFSRREEAASLEPGDGAPARERAALAAASLVRSTMETRPVAPPCVESRAGDTPGAIDLACGDLRVEVLPGSGPGDDDAVRISRASSCSGP